MTEKKLNILFTRNDVDKFTHVELCENVNICDFDLENYEVTKADVTVQDARKLIDSTIKIFDEISTDLSIKEIKGYANNFYECSVLPVAKYMVALENEISQLLKEGISNSNITVIYPTQLFFSPKYSAYYMAEHESYKKFQYEREYVFLPYLEQISRNYGVNIEYKSRKTGFLSTIFKITRLMAVISYRQILLINVAVTSIFKKRLKREPNVNEDPSKVVVVTRSQSQTEALEGLIANCEEKVDWIFAYSLLNLKENHILGKIISKEHTNINPYYLSAKYGRTVKYEISHIMKLFFLKSYSIRVCDVKIDLKQSIREILIMLTEMSSYKEALSETLQVLGYDEDKVLLTGEQKSPHAWADAEAAAENNIKCIQIMLVDQGFGDLPLPIAGDAFITDTSENFNSFKDIWPKYSKKLHYVGQVKDFPSQVLKAPKIGSFKSDSNKRLTFCIFLQADDLMLNKSVLDQIGKLSKQHVFLIRLHPRDRLSNYSKYLATFEFLEKKIRKEVLFSLFDCGITFPSAVTTELEFRQKPYIYLNFGKWAKWNDHKTLKNDIATVIKSEDIHNVFHQIQPLYENFLSTVNYEDTGLPSAHHTLKKIINLDQN